MTILFNILYIIASLYIFIFNINKYNNFHTNIYILILILLIIQNINYYNDINYILKLIYLFN